MSINRPSTGMRRRTHGQALVEFALVLPIFLVAMFGLIDVGRLIYQHSVLSQAAREGARLAAVEAYWVGSSDASCGQAGGPVCPANFTALRNDVTAAVNRMTVPFGTIASGSVQIKCDPDGTSPPTGNWTNASCASRVPQQSIVSVRVEMTFNPITPIVSGLVGSVTTSGSATMVLN
jgi:Flp pilus assembly protein TadG